MIVGTGMLAEAFSPVFEKNSEVCVYAAGVSNSGCIDKKEFLRERERLSSVIKALDENQLLVYFSTCSIYDSEVADTPYVKHKLLMEELVRSVGNYLVIRLPQVVGRTENPHTLLNYLYSRIIRSESFNLWVNAKRNIIDVQDVALICEEIINSKNKFADTINVANPRDYKVTEIIEAFEVVLGKTAIYNREQKGSKYIIDVSTMLSLSRFADSTFGENYLINVVKKYYGK